MTSLVPTPVAELLRVGKREGSMPVGVVIRVEKRSDLLLASRLADELLTFARGRLAKAALPDDIVARDARIAELAPRLQDDLVVYFDGLLVRAGADVAKDVAFPLDPDDLDWKLETKLLTEILEAIYINLGELAFGAAGDQLGLELSFTLEGPATAPIRAQIATEVTRINATTREILRDKVERAVAEGTSIDELVRGKGSEPGLRDLFGSRARTIALTETANAYNAAAVAGYAETGLVDEVEVFDGPDCGWLTHDDPDLAHGSHRTLEEAARHVISHPHCQRAFGAVVAR